MQLFQSDTDIRFLTETFEGVGFCLLTTGGSSFISCFVCSISAEDKLSSNWKKINNSISANYQSLLEDDFSAWNIYLLFLCAEEVSLELQYKIESDTFGMRKVVKYAPNEIVNNDQELFSLCSKMIFGDDLTLKPTVKQAEQSSSFNNVLRLKLEAHGSIPTDGKVKSIAFRTEIIENLIQGLSLNEIQES